MFQKQTDQVQRTCPVTRPPPPHGNSGQKRDPGDAIDWKLELIIHITILVDQMGEQMPDSHTIHMPVSILPAHLHDDFVMEMLDKHTDLTQAVSLVMCYRQVLPELMYFAGLPQLAVYSKDTESKLLPSGVSKTPSSWSL